ncbi:short chain dehydrogenase [Microbacterium sp. CIAB417]|uniref:short chain dehydrogenase n=1 Tax=Microbacterium sp. CIAB417 TaxID=2860287 RepID=UPI001FADA2DC|nr:short chain dehydrogenase [Microbacterium sp. CIAB417]
MRQNILVIGASGLIGATVASALETRGHTVIRASRSSDERVDVRDRDSLDSLFSRVGALDAVVTAFGSTPFKPLEDLSLDDIRSGLEDKTLGQIAVAAAAVPRLRDGGSITVTSGILSTRPVPTGAAASTANGAVNAYILAVAPYLPRGLRINAISPNVLVEAPGYHASFPGFSPVPASVVADAYVDAVEGDMTGEVISV